MLTIINVLIQVTNLILLGILLYRINGLNFTNNSIIIDRIEDQTQQVNNVHSSVTSTLINSLSKFQNNVYLNNTKKLERYSILFTTISDFVSKIDLIVEQTELKLRGMAKDRTLSLVQDMTDSLKLKVDSILTNLKEYADSDMNSICNMIEELKSQKSLSSTDGKKLLELRQTKLRIESIKEKSDVLLNDIMQIKRKLDGIYDSLAVCSDKDEMKLMLINNEINDLKVIIERIQGL